MTSLTVAWRPGLGPGPPAGRDPGHWHWPGQSRWSAGPGAAQARDPRHSLRRIQPECRLHCCLYRHSLGLWPGPGRRQLWKLSSQNVLRLFCGLSEAAEDSRRNGCPLKSVSERCSERNRMSDLQSPASDRAPIADTPTRSYYAPMADMRREHLCEQIIYKCDGDPPRPP